MEKSSLSKKVYEKTPCLDTFHNQYVYARLTIDARKKRTQYRACAKIQCAKRRIYIDLGKSYTLKQFKDVCNKNKPTYKGERENLEKAFARVTESIDELARDGTFSFERLREKYAGIYESNDLYALWNSIIKSSSVGTAASYRYAMKRFQKDMGDKVMYTDLSQEFIKKWKTRMKDCRLSSTSIGIYLRSFRVVANEASKKGYIKKGIYEKLFGKDCGIDHSISRKHEYLDADTMIKLYNFWEANKAEDENGKEMFWPEYKKNIFNSLGMFLFMYLGNGMNLADALRLKYDKFYFDNGKSEMRFFRNKTRDRSENESEVIFPLIPQIKRIIEETGLPESEGGMLFPALNDRMSEETKRKIIAQENSNIADRVQVVCKILSIDHKPSPTWCRHSFATNLKRAGVPMEYIADSMGHSSGKDVTSKYMAAYPTDIMCKYNGLLLSPQGDRADVMKILAEQDTDKLKKIIESLNLK